MKTIGYNGVHTRLDYCDPFCSGSTEVLGFLTTSGPFTWREKNSRFFCVKRSAALGILLTFGCV